ncbi:MAG: BlaI/MecI/CopY family transcriptional regulator [Bacteroidota bacterium]
MKLPALTPKEEKVMQLIWRVGRGTVSQFIDQLPDPKPPHSSISTVVRSLEGKGYLGHKAYGRTYEYFPIITKRAYSGWSLKGLVSSYFGGSMNELVSFLVEEEDLTPEELKALAEKLEEE